MGRLHDRFRDLAQVTLDRDDRRELPAIRQVVHEPGQRGLVVRVPFLELEQDLADLSQVRADRVLDLPKCGDGLDRVGLDAPAQRLDLQDCAGHGLG